MAHTINLKSSRAVVQVEPVAVACMIRIFLRYIVEVEGLATKGFTKQQNNCYIKTLEVGVIVLS